MEVPMRVGGDLTIFAFDLLSQAFSVDGCVNSHCMALPSLFSAYGKASLAVALA
jgi:hypothetical protein